MMNTRTHPIRRAVSIAAFVTALILLTGTPAKVREIAMNHSARSCGEYQVATQ